MESFDLGTVAAKSERERLGNRLAGEVVLCGAEAAHYYQNIGTAEGGTDGVDKVLQAVPDNGFERDSDADLIEFLGEIKGVGVLAPGGKHFGTDGDDFGFHKSRVQGTVISSWSLRQTEAFYAQVHIINGLIGGENGIAEGGEGDADEVDSGENERGLALGSHANQSATPVKAGCEVDVAVF
jgi:hypothetical protein